MASSTLSYINPGYQPGRFPIVSAGELPFLVGEAHGGIRAIDAWYRKYGPAEMKDVKLCFSFILDPLRMHSRNKKVVVPGDIKGMKIRPCAGHHGGMGDAARRHQRVVESVGNP